MAAQRDLSKYWFFVIGVVALAALWVFFDRPVSSDPLTGVVTEGVWKMVRGSKPIYQGRAKVEDGAFVNFTAFQSVPVGARIKFYRHHRPLSGLTTYEYAGR